MGRDGIIPLWFGESDLVTPACIREAAKKALDDGFTFYSRPEGHPPLVEAIARYLERIYGVAVDRQRIVVPGSTMLAVMIAAQCLLEKGDEILLIGPYWPNVRTVVEILGAVAIEVRLREGPHRWWLDMDEIRRAVGPRTRAIYVNSPSNPTGWVADRSDLMELVELCRRHGIGLISDEVYHRNLFSDVDAAPSVLPLVDEDEPVFVLNGFSKGWAMTGWRLGWMVAPRSLAEPLAVLAECNHTGAAVFAQYGGVAALEQGEEFLAAFRTRCRQNRALLLDRLATHPGIELLAPEGAFYAFPKLLGIEDSLAFCRQLVAEEGVGLAPGYTFGRNNRRHVRLCFAIAPRRLERALDRLIRFLDHTAA